MATTTPNYGWSVPTSTDYVAQGAVAIETLGDSVDATLFTALGGNYPGLRLVKKQTVGTAVSTVNVTNAFSATYDNYLITYTGGDASVVHTLGMRIGNATTLYYYSLIYASLGTTTVVGLTNNGTAPNFALAGGGSSNGVWLNATVRQPFMNQWTFIENMYADVSGGGSIGSHQGFLANTNSYTDFTLVPSSGTLTGGTIYVYGYGMS